MKTCWSEIKNTVKHINQTFYELVEEIGPGDDLPLTIAKYGYGQPVSDSENFYLPNQDGICTKPLSMQSPLSMVLENTFELYFKTNTGTAPWKIYYPGDFLSVLGEAEIISPYSFSPGNIFGSTAGSRTAFTLNLYTNNEAFKKIRAYYSIPDDINPINHLEHYKIFKTIAEKESSPWRATRLFFDDKWRNLIRNHKDWIKVKGYFYQQALIMSTCLRNSFFLNYAIRDIARSLNLKQKEYSEDIIKQILLSAVGEIPAFVIGQDETSLPLNLLVNRLNELYDDYSYGNYNIPVIMHSVTNNKSLNHTLYLSISENDLATYDIKSFRPLLYLSEIKECMGIYLEEFKDHILTKNTIYGEMASRLNLHYYSERGESKQGILKASELLHEQQVASMYKKYMIKDTQTFPGRAPFFKALVGFDFKKP